MVLKRVSDEGGKKGMGILPSPRKIEKSLLFSKSVVEGEREREEWCLQEKRRGGMHTVVSTQEEVAERECVW